MKKIIYIFAIALFGVPFLAFAGSNCSSTGYTIATINGIFSDDSGAKQNLRSLQEISPEYYKEQKVNYQYLLNPTHLAGIGDLAMAAYQKYFEDETVKDYDLVEMIRSAVEKVTTRKLLLVAHSQGNFYANSFYDTVAGQAGGVPAESIGVYAVATPASRVAGGGKWLTSDTDKVITGLADYVPNRTIMPPNTSIKIGANDNQTGHLFNDTYLKYRGAEIVSGIESSLDKLKSPSQDLTGPCINPPELTLTHKLQGLVLSVLDPVATLSSNIIAGVFGTTYNVAKKTGGSVVATANNFNNSLAAMPKSSLIASANPLLTAKIVASSDMESNPLSEVVAETPPPPVAIASDVIAPQFENIQPKVEEVKSVDGYIAIPLVYEATPLPESYPIPSYSGGGSVDDFLPAVADLPVQILIKDATTTTEIVAIIATSTDPTSTIIIVLAPTTTSSLPPDPATLAANRPVVINELAWGGTSSNSDDEWIELYNRSLEDINLDGYTLYSKTDESPYINLSGIIKAHNYFLIEAKNSGETDEATQSSVKNIVADMWVSFGARMSNSGENIILSYASTTIDEIPFCFNWCGVPSSRTTERINPDALGTDSSNWSANSTVIMSGINSAGNPIIGTPHARNSLNYLINGGASITSDLTLTKSNSPYLVYNSTQTIAEGKTLNIEPGVVIKFTGSGKLFADGNIIANGTVSDPVVFTAFADDTYGGDMDGVVATPARGSWFGVELSSKSASSSFDHNIFRYGGDTIFRKSMLYISQASPSVTNSVFENSKIYGLYLDHSSATVSGNSFRNNTGDPFSAGMSIAEGAPNVSSNNFTQNNIGMNVTSKNATIVNNNFSVNTTALSFNGPSGIVTGNKGEMGDVIKLSGSIATAPATTTLVANPMPYFLSGIVMVQSYSTLDIKEGTIIKNSMNGSASQLNIYGKLNIDTSTTSGVTFTSDQPTLARSSWMGILMLSGSKSYIKGATISGASFGIKYINSPVSLENVILNTNTMGIDGTGAGSVLKALNVIFTNNGIDKNPSNLW